jgi:hypothetical protein
MTAMCMTSAGFDFSTHSTPPDCHQLYMAIVANALLGRSCSRSVFHSVVIFVKYRKVPTRTILPIFIDHCRDSVVFAFWQRRGQRQRKRKRTSGKFWIASIRFPWPTRTIPQANQNNFPGQLKRSLRAATGVRYSYYVQLVAMRRNHTLARSSFIKEEGLSVAITCICGRNLMLARASQRHH